MDIVMYNCFYAKFINLLKVAKSKTNNTKKDGKGHFWIRKNLRLRFPEVILNLI
jgi:hypothetical protein